MLRRATSAFGTAASWLASHALIDDRAQPTHLSEGEECPPPGSENLIPTDQETTTSWPPRRSSPDVQARTTTEDLLSGRPPAWQSYTVMCFETLGAGRQTQLRQVGDRRRAAGRQRRQSRAASTYTAATANETPGDHETDPATTNAARRIGRWSQETRGVNRFH